MVRLNFAPFYALFGRIMQSDVEPTQIASDNNKFIFSHVKQGARAKDLEDALEWIVNAGIAYKLNMVPMPELPLSGMAQPIILKSPRKQNAAVSVG